MSTRFAVWPSLQIAAQDLAISPSFRLVVQPNDWEKTVRAITTSHGEPSAKQLLYTQFWTAWIDRLAKERPEWSRATAAPRYGWFAMPTGLSGASYYAYFTKRGLSSELSTIPLKADQQAGRRRRGARGRLPAFDPDAYRQRNVVERAVNKLRNTRAVATRYDKRDYVYRGTIDVAAIRIWLRDPVETHLQDTP
jgi:hypothetical protein